jgi:cell division septation protein DedD
MKYENALVKMNLKAEDFPNSTRKKISDIAKIQKELAELEKSGEVEEANEAKEIIENLDSQLEQTILSFDVEAHRARLKKLADMREKRWNKDGENKEKKVEPVKVAQVEPKPTPQPTQTQQPAAAQPTNPAAQQPEKVIKIDNVTDKKQDVEEYEEFENQGNAKNKKVNRSAIGIGVGALILTFGAVNYFKNNK